MYHPLYIRGPGLTVTCGEWCVPPSYYHRTIRYGDKIVMMVMDETHKLRHFYLTPQSDGTVEISPGVFKTTLQEAMENFERFPPQGQDGRPIVLFGMVKVDAAPITHLKTRSPAHSLAHSAPTHPPTHLLPHSAAHPLAHPLRRPPTRPPTPPCPSTHPPDPPYSL